MKNFLSPRLRPSLWRCCSPKMADCLCHILSVYRLIQVPFSWKQGLIFLSQETVVQKQDYSPILHGSDDPSRGLHDLVHARVLIRIVKALVLLLIKIFFLNFLFCTDHGKPCSHNGGADEPVFFQINPLGKDSSHHTERHKRFLSLLLKKM